MRPSEWWASALRVATGAYWLYFAAQKWPPRGVDWMQSLIQANPKHEPIPGVQQLLQYLVAPNWHFFAVLQGGAETVVGLLLVLGVATRLAAIAGTLLALELALTVAFLVTDGGFQWLYYLAVLLNFQIFVGGGGPASVDGWWRRPRPRPA
jgi:uncharacterized membrane protein YphA (DoxX/SURF4 family)